jgi:multidrug efflux pump subunit AcrB
MPSHWFRRCLPPLPADMVSQILNFGAPAPIDVQVVGNDLQADRTYANALLARIKRIPGVADARIQQAFQQPTLNVDVDRSLAGLVGLSEKDAATAILTTLAGSSQTSPTYWLNPQTGVSYAVSAQTPQREIGTIGGLQNLPLTAATGSADSQLLGGLATIQHAPSNAVVSHYNVRPVIDIHATPQGRDLGAVAADIARGARPVFDDNTLSGAPRRRVRGRWTVRALLQWPMSQLLADDLDERGFIGPLLAFGASRHQFFHSFAGRIAIRI